MNKLISKRFICWLVSLVVFLILSIFTKHDIFQIATSVSLLSGIYIAADSIKPSQNKKIDMDKYLDSVEDNYHSKIKIENKKLRMLVIELEDKINKLELEIKELKDDKERED